MLLCHAGMRADQSANLGKPGWGTHGRVHLERDATTRFGATLPWATNLPSTLKRMHHLRLTTTEHGLPTASVGSSQATTDAVDTLHRLQPARSPLKTRVRIPVNVTADSGIVTGIPMNVTGAGVARIDCSLRVWFSGFWLLFIEHSRWLWSLWSKGCAVGNSKSCPRQVPRCAAGASSTNPQPRMCGFVSVRFRRLRPHYRVIRQPCSLLPPPSCGSTRRPA